mmetsp:Transcript_28900/g.66153  ORF Transcript_28900/g.66153 Transcript_28900/m.66153 type:complete len:222 (+) Transcript_28900:740-1405(+)
MEGVKGGHLHAAARQGASDAERRMPAVSARCPHDPEQEGPGGKIHDLPGLFHPRRSGASAVRGHLPHVSAGGGGHGGHGAGRTHAARHGGGSHEDGAGAGVGHPQSAGGAGILVENGGKFFEGYVVPDLRQTGQGAFSLVGFSQPETDDGQKSGFSLEGLQGPSGEHAPGCGSQLGTPRFELGGGGGGGGGQMKSANGSQGRSSVGAVVVLAFHQTSDHEG